jgi:exosortase
MNSSAAAPDWRASLAAPNIAAALAVAGIFYALFGWFPYASGYGATRTSMFAFMGWIWQNNPEWEHCWLVPLAVIGLVEGSWLGLAALLGSLFVYWIGYLADNIYVGYASLLAFTGSAVLWFLGWRWLMALAFPLAFLAFMFPLPFMDNFLAFPLRVLMSSLSVGFLNLVGLPCLQQGTSIVSAPDFAAGLAAGERFAVDVADPCSGIRSLFALMMVSALYGYIAMDKAWQKWAVFLSSIPLAVAGNFARIIMLTLGTIALGPEVAIGSLEEPTFFHMLSGFLVFAVALGGMLGVGWLLQRFTPRTGPNP